MRKTTLRRSIRALPRPKRQHFPRRASDLGPTVQTKTETPPHIEKYFYHAGVLKEGTRSSVDLLYHQLELLNFELKDLTIDSLCGEVRREKKRGRPAPSETNSRIVYYTRFWLLQQWKISGLKVPILSLCCSVVGNRQSKALF